MVSEDMINRWLAEYGAQQGIQLSLKYGQCVLVDQDEREALVLELPPSGNIVLLHCQLQPLPPRTGGDQLRTLLELNFNIDAMRGCWFSLDEQQTVRLCYQQPLDGLDKAAFIRMLEGFIQQGIDVRDYLGERLA